MPAMLQAGTVIVPIQRLSGTAIAAVLGIANKQERGHGQPYFKKQ